MCIRDRARSELLLGAHLRLADPSRQRAPRACAGLRAAEVLGGGSPSGGRVVSAARTIGPQGAIRFRDAGDQERFERSGYVVVPFLEGDQLDELRTLWQEVCPDQVDGIYSNVHGSDVEVNRRVDRTITAAFTPGANRLFEDASLGGASFLVKGCGPDSASTLHQDWNLSLIHI